MIFTETCPERGEPCPAVVDLANATGSMVLAAVSSEVEQAAGEFLPDPCTTCPFSVAEEEK